MKNQKERVNGLDVNRKELIKAIKIVLPIAPKTIWGDCILFDSDRLRSFNDCLSISYLIETGVSGAVRAVELHRVLTKMKGETIQVMTDDDSLVLRDSHTVLRLHQLPEDGVAKLKMKIASLKIQQLTWQPVPKGFAEGLPLCLFSTGKDNLLGRISGVVFAGRNILATDNYRVSRYQMKSAISDKPFRLKTRLVTSLIELKKDFQYVAIEGEWLHLKTEDNLILSTRTMPAQDYPISEVMGVFDKEGFRNAAEIYQFPEDLEESIERAMILAGMGGRRLDFSTQVSLWREGGYLLVKGRNDAGEVIDRIPWPEGMLPEGIEVKISPFSLRKVLPITRRFKLSPTGKSILFEVPNFQYLISAKVSGNKTVVNGPTSSPMEMGATV